VQGLTAFLTELLPSSESIRARWRRCGGNAAAKTDGADRPIGWRVLTCFLPVGGLNSFAAPPLPQLESDL
jgi:hypothetical protein